MEKLKSCPFCGGNGRIYTESYSHRKNDIDYFIECRQCASCTDIFETEEDAIEAWNRRAKD